MKLTVDRVVVQGLTQPPDPIELRERLADEVRAAARALDAQAVSRDPTVLVAGAVARAAGARHE
jgi:hypothetical protein